MLKERPEDINYKYEYGYDKDNRPVVERQYITFSGGRDYKNEEFWIYDGDCATVYHFPYDPVKKVMSVKRALSLEGKVTQLGRRYEKNHGVQTYNYVDSALNTITYQGFPLN